MARPASTPDGPAAAETAAAPVAPVAAVGTAIQHEVRFSASLLRRWGVLLAAIGGMVVLPLWGFAEIGEEIREREAIFFDAPILRFAHGLASARLDRMFLWVTDVGYLHGVVPLDFVLVAALTLTRRFREATFAAIALGGSALINMATKVVFARGRPSLWDSIAPETTFSFPSGHAMGSATLACVLIALSWHSRWRWLVAVPAVVFVGAVGFSRVYLGVHYPSDIVAGWAAATAWAVAAYVVVYRLSGRPWVAAG